MYQLNSSIVAYADTHCHILPSWDDGPNCLDESIRMARRAAESGLKFIVVTPHVGNCRGSNTEQPAHSIASATAELQSSLLASGIEIGLVPGAEVTLADSAMISRIGTERALTVGGMGRFVLLETPGRTWPAHMNQALFEISLQGITPIIAHPERIPEVQRDFSILEEVVSRGALLQLTARTLLDPAAEGESALCSRRLLEAGLVSLIASDAHSSRSVLPGQVSSLICELVGESAAHQLLVENPRLVLEGAPVSPVRPQQPTRKKTGWRSFVQEMVSR